MSWQAVDRSVHRLLEKVSRVDEMTEASRERLLAEIVELDHAVHEEIDRNRAGSSRTELFGCLLIVALMAVAGLLGAGIYRRFLG